MIPQYAPEQVQLGTYDPEEPDTGNVPWDGLIITTGAMVLALGWFCEHVTDGRWRSALRAQFSMHRSALDASDWADGIEKDQEHRELLARARREVSL